MQINIHLACVFIKNINIVPFANLYKTCQLRTFCQELYVMK
jgi:hypothetical protein